MHSQIEKDVKAVISNLDEAVWNAVAIKAIEKITPGTLTDLSTKMFHDFTTMVSANTAANEQLK
jgi:hypothetical protein